MSSTYNLEPPPTAKVILKTSQGDLVLELFAKQVPLATKNFLQHCLDGYYDNTIFHRLVPGFILQGGDPTGVGTGGVAAINNGQPFADEFHSRLRFNRRGLLGMANSGEPNDNTSQFFLTLDNTPELQGKNTMFGRIEGDTIYNLMKMSEAELADGASDRPLYPTRVLGAEILVNPFDDMVKRVAATSAKDAKKGGDAKKKRKVTGKTLLSFDDEDDEPAVSRSKKHKLNPSFRPADKSIQSGTPAPAAASVPVPVPSPAIPADRPQSPFKSPDPGPTAAKPSAAPAAMRHKSPSPSPPVQESPVVTSTMTALDRTNAQIAALKQSMKRDTSSAGGGGGGKASANATERPKKKSALEAMIPEGATRGRKRGTAPGSANGGDPAALESFNAFRRKLDAMAALGGARGGPSHGGLGAGSGRRTDNDDGTRQAVLNGAANDTGAPGSVKGGDGDERNDDGGAGLDADADADAKICDLHFIANCQSCTAWDKEQGEDVDVDVDEEDTSWLAHSLSFAKDSLGKDLEWKKKMDGLEEFDPRAQGAGAGAGTGSGSGPGSKFGAERDRRRLK